MAIKLKVAIADGNWSNTATWSRGVKPIPGDVVALNGKVVTVDEDVNVDTITGRAYFESQVDLIPYMLSNLDSSNTLNRGEVISWDNNVNAYNIFRTTLNTTYNGNIYNSSYTLGSFNGINNLWIGYKFNTATVVDGIFYRNTSASTARNVKQFAFEASNDGTSWTTLHTSTVLFGQNYIANGIGNSTAYTYYRMRVLSIQNTVTDSASLSALLMFAPNTDLSAIGNDLGRLVVSGSGTRTITCTGTGIAATMAGSNDFLTYTGSGVLNINSDIYHITADYAGGNRCTVRHTGTGTINIVGNLKKFKTLNNQIKDYMVYSTYFERYGLNYTANGTGTTNIIGDIQYDSTGSGQPEGMIKVEGGHTLNITGNTYQSGVTTATSVTTYSFIDSTINIVGDILMTISNTATNFTFATLTNCIYTHTGKIEKVVNPSGTGNLIMSITQTISLRKTNIIGSIINTNLSNVLVSKTDLLDGFHITGPIIFSDTAFNAIGAINCRFIANTVGTYIRHRDTSNNAYVLVSPDTLVDSPAIQNVRLGVSYAVGNYVGTLAVPPANRVSVGVPVDNTVGTAALTPADVWNYLTSNLTTANSIGERLKNASTVETTGDQIASLY